ncbi:hypothetical protein TNCV_2393301 [Trichonephila clavipes]|nr:hypothetical protein TNCV_2393301 [Trichonephila clavipes]
MTSHNRLDDSLRWRTVDRFEASQCKAYVTRSLQVALKWYLDCGINSKQVVLSTVDQPSLPRGINICTGSLLGF